MPYETVLVEKKDGRSVTDQAGQLDDAPGAGGQLADELVPERLQVHLLDAVCTPRGDDAIATAVALFDLFPDTAVVGTLPSGEVGTIWSVGGQERAFAEVIRIAKAALGET